MQKSGEGITLNDLFERNESKYKILRKYLLYNLRYPFIKFQMMATTNFKLENSTFFGIDLVYPIPIFYQLLNLIFELFIFLEHPKGQGDSWGLEKSQIVINIERVYKIYFVFSSVIYASL